MNARRTRAVLVAAVILVVSAGAPDRASAQSAREAIENRITKLERALDNRGLLDLLQQVERLQGEVQALRGQIEEQDYTIVQLRKTQRDTYVDIDQRLQSLQGGGGMVISEPGGAPPLATLVPGQADTIAGIAPESSLQMQDPADPAGSELATEPASTEISVDGPDTAVDAAVAVVARASIAPRGPTIDNEASEAAYRDAFSLLKAGQYDESIAAFSDFLAQHPDSQYADNAQYWLGETYYVKREFEPALVEYRKLIEVYPTSKKCSHAMLKIGYSYDELGQLDQARAVLEDLRNRYAGTTAARLAEERIQILADADAARR